MAKPLIEIDNIGKRYRIGANREPYLSLRDEIMKLMRCCSPSARRAKRQADEFWALRNVSFAVGQGEAVGIIGRNGAGKSTLLKILSQITPPNEGKITMRGRVASLLEVGTGFHPELTGRENIYLNGAILGMTRREVASNFDEIVAFAEVERFLDTPVKRYSSGMYVRLAFAVAAHLDPEILIVDEVLAVGDAAFQKKCLARMGDVTTAGRTVLFVSHNIPMLRTLCSRAIWLSSGRLERDASCEVAISDYMKAFDQNPELSNARQNAELESARDSTGASDGIARVWLENSSSEPVQRARMGDSVTVCISYRLRSESPRPRFSIVFYDEIGSPVTFFDTAYSYAQDARRTTQDPTTGLAKCIIPKLPLLGGSYCINVALDDGASHVDFVSSAAMLSVDAADYYISGKPIPAAYARYGKVAIEHTWLIEPENCAFVEASP